MRDFIFARVTNQAVQPELNVQQTVRKLPGIFICVFAF